jgi:hypothetical protein
MRGLDILLRMGYGSASGGYRGRGPRDGRFPESREGGEQACWTESLTNGPGLSLWLSD